MRQCRLVFLLLLSFLSSKTPAQIPATDSTAYSPEKFEHYTLSNGLSNNRVFSLVQDQRGFVWVGTNHGLNRYDGRSFTGYFHNKKPLNLTGSQILRLMNFGQGLIGVNPSRGFELVNTKTFRSTFLAVRDTTYFSGFRGEVMDVARMGPDLFLMASATGVYTFNAGGRLLYRYDRYLPGDEEKSRLLYGRKVLSLNENEALILISYNSHNKFGLAYYNHAKKIYRHIGKSETLWKDFYPKAGSPGAHYLPLGMDRYLILHYRNRLVYHDHKTNRTIQTPVNFSDSLETGWTSKLFKINDSTFALTSHKSGFYLVHLDQDRRILRLNPHKYFTGILCRTMLLDKEKRLWIGTDEGLFKQRLSVPFVQTVPLLARDGTEPKGLLTAVYRLRDKLYVGLERNNEGLLVLDTATLKLEKHISFFKSKDGVNVHSIHQYRGDTLWLGTNIGILWLDLVSGKSGTVLDAKGGELIGRNDAISYPPDKRGDIWMTNTTEGDVARYNLHSHQLTFISRPPYPPLPFWRIKSLMFDAYGDVWIMGHGLARWNTAKKKVDTSFVVYAGPNKTESNIQAGITVPQGSIWFYNHNNILLEYGIKQKRFVEHDHENMPVDIESVASYVENNQLWLIAAGPKLVCYDLKTGQVTYFDQKDGLPEIGPTSSDQSIYYDQQAGKFYSLHKTYISRFSSTFPRSKFATDPLVFTSLKNNETVIYNPVGGISVPYSSNDVTLSFSAIDFEPSHIYWFFYKTDNGTWNDLNQQQTISFSNMAYGRNLITVKAINKSGQVFVKSLMIIVVPPWWATWWFRSLLILLLAGGIYGSFRYRLAQQLRQREAEIRASLMAQEAERQRFSRELHDGIRANLSLLKMYISSFGDANIPLNELKDRSEKLLAGSVDEIRRLIHDMHPRNLKEMGLVRAVMEMVDLVNLGNGPRIVFTAAQIPEHLSEQVEINVFRIVQELLQNAMKHSGATNVWLQFRYHENILVITYKDNGVGFDTSLVHDGNGLLNIRNRVMLLKGGINQNSGPEGTEFNMRIFDVNQNN